MANDSKLITIYISQNKADIVTKIPIIHYRINFVNYVSTRVQ